MDEGLQVQRRLRELIDDGSLQSQTRLPPERVLAKRLGATRWSLRKALASLEAEGRVWRHVGKGTFIGARPAIAKEHLALLCRHASPTDLIEARLLLESSLAALAALRATPEEIERIADAARKCWTARNIDAYEAADEVFHHSVAVAAHNVLLLSVFNGFNAVRKEIVWGHLQRTALKRHRRRFYATQHDAVAAAISNRDAEGARRAMWSHLKSLEQVYSRVEQASAGLAVSVGL